MLLTDKGGGYPEVGVGENRARAGHIVWHPQTHQKLRDILQPQPVHFLQDVQGSRILAAPHADGEFNLGGKGGTLSLQRQLQQLAKTLFWKVTGAVETLNQAESRPFPPAPEHVHEQCVAVFEMPVKAAFGYIELSGKNFDTDAFDTGDGQFR